MERLNAVCLIDLKGLVTTIFIIQDTKITKSFGGTSNIYGNLIM